MKKTHVILNIDKLLISVSNPSRFQLLEEFKEINNIKTNISTDNQKLYKEFKEVCLSYGYIELIDLGAFKFTAKGYEAREAGGHFRYLKSIKPKMAKFERWSILIAIGAVIISGLTFYYEYNSKVENEELIKRIEVLEKQIKK